MKSFLHRSSSKEKKPFAFFLLVISLIIAYGVSFTLTKKSNFLPFNFYLVQSGSMEPSIMTGDIIVVKKYPEYKERETITFYDQNSKIITHRIIKKTSLLGKRAFFTKGDANEQEDIKPVLATKIIGKTVMILPKLGFLVIFAKSRYGSVLFIIVPAVIIIYDEFKTITSTKK